MTEPNNNEDNNVASAEDIAAAQVAEEFMTTIGDQVSEEAEDDADVAVEPEGSGREQSVVFLVDVVTQGVLEDVHERVVACGDGSQQFVERAMLAAQGADVVSELVTALHHREEPHLLGLRVRPEEEGEGAGALVVETLFAWPGIGHELVHSVFGRDVPMIQGAALCMGVLFVVFNLGVDAACLVLDPRRRAGGAA